MFQVIRGWIVRNRIRKLQSNQLENFFRHISLTSINLINRLNSQNNYVLQNDLVVIEDDYLIIDRTNNGKDINSKIRKENVNKINFNESSTKISNW